MQLAQAGSSSAMRTTPMAAGPCGSRSVTVVPRPGSRGQRELPAEQLGQPPGVGQAQPGSAPADAGDLEELLEDVLNLVGRDADAGVGDHELDVPAAGPHGQP